MLGQGPLPEPCFGGADFCAGAGAGVFAGVAGVAGVVLGVVVVEVLGAAAAPAIPAAAPPLASAPATMVALSMLEMFM
jgi:hypothetical protein